LTDFVEITTKSQIMLGPPKLEICKEDANSSDEESCNSHDGAFGGGDFSMAALD
jgi:hypothetical protein